MIEYRTDDKSGVGIKLAGYYKLQVVDPHTGVIVEDRPWKKNLILNCGLNVLGTSNIRIAECNTVGIIGSGSRPNYFTSSTSAITQSGNLVYLYDTSGDITNFNTPVSTYPRLVEKGDTIQYANLSRSFVTALVDSRTVQVRESYSFDPPDQQTFTVWKTSQHDLEMEGKRATNYYVGSSSLLGYNCGTQKVDNVFNHRRTYQFSAETATPNASYTEIGVSWTGTPGASSSFARAVLDTPITIPNGFILRMAHDLKATYTPNYERYITASIVGWPVPGTATNTYATESIQGLADLSNTSYLDTNGNTGGMGVLEPYGANHDYFATIRGNTTFVSTVGNFLNNYNTTYNAYSYSNGNGGYWMATSNYNQPYIQDSFEMYKGAFYDITNIATDCVWTLGIGYTIYSFPSIYYSPYDHNGMLLRFNERQTKTSEMKFYFMWRFAWDRVLT